MRLTLRDGLILTDVAVAYQGRQIEVSDMVVDTGSATTMLSADVAARIGIVPESNDTLYVIYSIGRTEIVFSR